MIDPRVERISRDGVLIALILRAEYDEPGIHFFTEPPLSQQLAFMRHGAGTNIDAHVHNRVAHEVHHTQEVLFVRHGLLRVDFYTTAGAYLESRLLRGGDTILLAGGGHGFEVLEEVEMIEVKQGPYLGHTGKTRLPAAPPDAIRFAPADPAAPAR